MGSLLDNLRGGGRPSSRKPGRSSKRTTKSRPATKHRAIHKAKGGRRP